MKELKIILNGIKPLSLNLAYRNIPGRGRCKTKQYTIFELEVLERLCEFENELLDLVNTFDEHSNCLFVDYEFYYPSVLKKDGSMSKTGGDISNMVKVLEDIIFKKLKLNDSYRACGYVKKLQCKKVRTVINFRIEHVHSINMEKMS